MCSREEITEANHPISPHGAVLVCVCSGSRAGAEEGDGREDRKGRCG